MYLSTSHHPNPNLHAGLLVFRTMGNAVELIVTGSLNGNIERADNCLIEAINACGGMPTIMVTGAYFGGVPRRCEDYLQREKEVQVPLYVLGAAGIEESDVYPSLIGDYLELSEILPNVISLGKYGLFRLPSGRLIAFVGGSENNTQEANWTLSEADINELFFRCRKLSEIDVLLTTQWPHGLDTSQSREPITVKHPSALIARVSAVLKPRIHVASREDVPFTCLTNEGLTQFIGLPSLDSSAGNEWMLPIGFPLPPEGPPIPSPFGPAAT